MSFKSNLSQIVANQVGRLQGQLIAQAQNRVLDILSEFASQCPNQQRLQSIVRAKNTILNTINKLQRRVNALKATANRLDRSIRVARTAIAIIKRIPRPTVLQFVPDPGALVKGVPFSALTKLSDRLIQLNKILDGLEAEKQGILGVISSADQTLNSIKSRLELIDTAVSECAKEIKDPDQAQQLTSQIQPPENTGSEGIPSEEYTYRGYTLEIVQDPNSPAIAPRRYAIAKDRSGVTVLYGPSSFSSDTRVLLDEIKFRIDNQLP
jgi:DNA repair exonuclease SbcCD ATPase subunit